MRPGRPAGRSWSPARPVSVLHGADIVAARARGADAVMVGRAYLYGLMAGGEAGVARSLEILVSQVHRTLRLLGVARLAELGPEHVPPARHTRDVLDAAAFPDP